jgi:tRNA(Ser,Leu) C12 N-acetylase TAN1
MRVARRGWDQYHTAEIVRHLADAIDRKVDLKTPDKLVWIDVLSDAIAMSLLRPDEIFSIYASSK